jgi:Tfp pilus assembly protein PilV
MDRVSRVPRVDRRPGLAGDDGFTIIEVLVAALVLVVGLGALLGMLITANHAISTTRLRQAETSTARELLEDSRGLAYAQLTPGTIAAALQPQLPGAALSGTNLTVTRTINGVVNTSFNVSFNVCSLDSPSDGSGDHTQPPASGGVWCPDVADNGSTDSNPDDYKRLSITVTPTDRSTPVIQQTILIYPRPVNGPAVSCLSTSASCPGSDVTIMSGTSQTFNVTTTAQAQDVQWLVNGSQPPTAQVSGSDPYAPSGASSSFKWIFPNVDGNYTITAVAYDANGNSGTRSTLHITLNRHQAIAPTSVSAGWNDLIGGVDVQWVPSVDQDVLYYHVYHQYGNNPAALVATCGNGGNVTGVSCTDAPESAFAPPIPSARPNPCTSSSQSYATRNLYWVVGVDSDPSNSAPRESTAKSPQVDANLCDHPPNSPTNLNGTVNNGQLTLSWTSPATPADPDSWDSIQAWRVYRWPASRGLQPQSPGDRYQLVGNGPPQVTSFTDTSPDPSGIQQNYCVTSVDTHLDESPCSTTIVTK